MQRREVLRFLGTAALGPLLISLPAEERLRVGRALHTRALVSKPGQILNPDQMAQLRALADTILPRTDTPGAVEVGAPEFFDLLLAEWYPEAERNEIVSGMNALEERCRQSFGKVFSELDASNRAAFLKTVDGKRSSKGSPEEVYGRIKDGIIFGFVTSKSISELTRTTPIIPGRFDGCVPAPDSIMKLPQDQTWDAIVVGSGISGGWAAKELCEKGLRTLVLEAGRSIDPATDYVEHVQPWEKKFRGRGDRLALERDQFIQKNCYACDEYSGKFFVNDRENPYEFDADKPFHWIRGRHVGGRSIMWGRQVYRWSDLDFEANLKDGVAVDWPIRYADIAPWYDYVERFIGVSGQAEGLAQLPDGQFLPPMEMRCAEQLVRDKLMKKWGGERVLTIGRAAILTQNHNGRAACHYCGPCERGCITHSYFTSNGSTLPAAMKTGRLTLRPNSVVHSVIYDASRDRATGVRAIDGETMQPLEFRARVVFVCASALESARILLNSATDRFATGLGNSSGQLGRNVMDHTFGAGAGGTIAGMEDKTSYGRRPNGIYIARFRNVKDKHPNFIRGYGFQGGAGRGNKPRPRQGFGADFKKALLSQELGPWRFSIGGWAECLPREDNFIALHPTLKDKWGIPALKVQCTWGPNELALIEDVQTTAAEILEAAGATDVRTYNDKLPPGLCIHEMGTARMGRDPKTSVLNGWNQVWDAQNVFVTDGACMASSANQNPSITYMALTARAVAHAVDLLNRKEL